MNWHENLDKALLDDYYFELNSEEVTTMGNYTFNWIDHMMRYYPGSVPEIIEFINLLFP